MVFHLIIFDNKSPRVFRTLLSIQLISVFHSSPWIPWLFVFNLRIDFCKFLSTTSKFLAVQFLEAFVKLRNIQHVYRPHLTCWIQIYYLDFAHWVIKPTETITNLFKPSAIFKENMQFRCEWIAHSAHRIPYWRFITYWYPQERVFVLERLVKSFRIGYFSSMLHVQFVSMIFR